MYYPLQNPRKDRNNRNGSIIVYIFLAPDLNIGVTLASFQISGNTPFSNDELKIIDNGFDTRSPTSLTIVVGTLSGPAAFPFFSCLIAFNVKLLSTVLNFITFCSGLMLWRQSSPGLENNFLGQV